MEIVKLPAPILKRELKPAGPADFKRGDLAALVKQMHETMVRANGVGLAANQIGKDLRLFVVDQALAEGNGVPDAFLNPEITEYSKDTDDLEEGCLSIPGYYVPIRRARKVMFKATALDGKKMKFKARSFLARILQHETDHLNGLTIKDRQKKTR